MQADASNRNHEKLWGSMGNRTQPKNQKNIFSENGFVGEIGKDWKSKAPVQKTDARKPRTQPAASHPYAEQNVPLAARGHRASRMYARPQHAPLGAWQQKTASHR